MSGSLAIVANSDREVKVFHEFGLALRILLHVHFKCRCDKSHAAWTEQGFVPLVDHSHNVRAKACPAAEALGFDDYEYAVVSAAALSHDVGKIFLDEWRQGDMDLQQRREFSRKHTEESVRCLTELIQPLPEERDKWLLQDTLRVVKYHHEPWLMPIKRLKRPVWLLNLADTLVAACESRPEHPEAQSTEVAHEILVKRAFKPECAPDLATSLQAVNALRQQDGIEPLPYDFCGDTVMPQVWKFMTAGA